MIKYKSNEAEMQIKLTLRLCVHKISDKQQALPPITEALRGALAVKKVCVAEQDYRQYLVEKHQ